MKLVWGEGPKPATMMIIGESPGREEEIKGRPFVGVSGLEMDRYLRDAGLFRHRIRVDNLFKFRPVGDEKYKFTHQELLEWGKILDTEIEETQPNVILSLGAWSTKWLLGDVDMEAVSGVPHRWRKNDNIVVIPSYHPAYGLREPEYMLWIQHAFNAARLVIRGELSPELYGDRFPDPDYGMAEDLDFIGEVMEGGEVVMSLDTETYRDGELYMVSASVAPGMARVVSPKLYPELFGMIKAGKVFILVHNALFDFRKIRIIPPHFIDTMSMAFLLQLYPLGLKPLAYCLEGMKMNSYEEIVGTRADLSEVPLDIAVNYSCQDADATIRVFMTMTEMINHIGAGRVLVRDMGIVKMVIDMMNAGIGADPAYFLEVGEEFDERRKWLVEEIRRAVHFDLPPEFNPGSAPQVSKLLYDDLKLGKRYRIPRTVHGKSTAAAQLQKVISEHPVVQRITEWRSLKTLKDKYINILPGRIGKDGRIHTDLSITRVRHSGRLASSKPNLMAQPVRTEDGLRIRDGFVAPEGRVLVSTDYNQIEMRVMAHLSLDTAMVESYMRGKDVHVETAAEMFKIDPGAVDEMRHRYPAKRTGFGVINRITAYGLLREFINYGATGWDEAQCQDLLDRWFGVHPGVKEWMDRTAREVVRDGAIEDLWGRMNFVSEARSLIKRVKEDGIRRGCNMPIQSTAQGIIKEAMVRLTPMYEIMGGRVTPLIQVHDDILWEMDEDTVREVVPAFIAIMEGVIDLAVPMVVNVKIGKRWGSMEKWKES